MVKNVSLVNVSLRRELKDDVNVHLTGKTVTGQVLLRWKIRKTHKCLKCTPKDTELNWFEIPPTRTNRLSTLRL